MYRIEERYREALPVLCEKNNLNQVDNFTATPG